MEAILKSFILVAAAEMGDKTQLLAFVLASRFRKPWTIIAGIFAATILNHYLASLFGGWLSQQISPQTLRWILGGIFIAFSVWILIPDKEEGLKETGHFGAFLTTFTAFFMAEMGDKTQLATVALAASYQSAILVTIGTTLGMMFSNGLAVFFGEKLTTKIPMKWIRIFAALLFVLFGIGVIVGMGSSS